MQRRQRVGRVRAPQQARAVRVEHALGVRVRARVRLAQDGAAQRRLPARDLVPDAGERGLEGALAEARERVRGAPEEVGVAEEERGLAVPLPGVVGPVARRVRAQHAGARQQQVADELDVEGPVARVVEDEDGVDLGVGGRQGPRGGRVQLRHERVEGVDGRVRGEDVGGRQDVPEAVLLGDGAALGRVRARDQDVLVAEASFLALAAVHQLLEGRVRLDEVVRREFDTEPRAQVRHAVRLVLAAAVRQQDERDVVLLEVLQRPGGAGDRLCDVE